MMAIRASPSCLLDELNIVLRYDYPPVEEVVAALQAKRPELHVCLTGRNARRRSCPRRPGHRDGDGETSIPRRRKRRGSVRLAFRHGQSALLQPSRCCQGTGPTVGSLSSHAIVPAPDPMSALIVPPRPSPAVRPFKPQNMSNNAAVTADGGEIGRAQALQARACGVPPSVHMNPVLLKPQTEIGAQVVVQGRVFGNARGAEYHRLKPQLMPKVLESSGARDEADLILVEGAGSPAEINLRQGDIANMVSPRAADLPVVLIGDIDRGGVIAGIVGTQMPLRPEEAARMKGS